LDTVLEFDTNNSVVLPKEFQNDDVRFSDSFAEYFIERFSKIGNVVFDPFAGFGTTLYAAEKLDRKAFGIEYLPGRVAYIKTNMENPNRIICGNSLKLGDFNLPMIDFLLTSPPYMRKMNHPEYPFAGYQVTGQGYEDYLNDIAEIFSQVRRKMKKGAYAVIEVSNIVVNDEFTPLAWDIGKSVNDVLPLQKEIIIKWQSEASPKYGYGFDHSYALIFQNNLKDGILLK
jgi:DNA modification methylase